MIIETIIGALINLALADSATGQNLSRVGVMAYKLHKTEINRNMVQEEIYQLKKDIILEQGGIK